MMRYISTRAAVSKFEPSDGPPHLFVDLEGPGGAPSNTISVAMTLDVARKLGEAAGDRPQATLDAIVFWYESFLGPVLGTTYSLNQYRERRRKQAIDFAQKIAKAFPGILNSTKGEM